MVSKGCPTNPPRVLAAVDARNYFTKNARVIGFSIIPSYSRRELALYSLI
jgi:hypothetical protein